MTMMMIKTLLLCSTLALGANAFSLPSLATTTRSNTCATTLCMAQQQQRQGGAQQGGAQQGGEQRVPEGTHEELMYALGVNLARQLGDVRPRKCSAVQCNQCDVEYYIHIHVY